MMHYQAVIIGCSAGGVSALSQILPVLPADFPLPIIVVSHQFPYHGGLLSKVLNEICQLTVQDAEEKIIPRSKNVYTASPNYHLLINENGQFELNIDPKVSFCRPSLDVTFETAAEFYQNNLISIVLTGANADGTQGAKVVKEYGGIVIVQSPETAESKSMPASVIAAGFADYIVPLEDISTKLLDLINWKSICK